MSDSVNEKVIVHGVRELWAREPFKIIEYDTEHQSADGERMIRFNWISFERGNAVAVVLYKSDTREVVIVRQFRAPTLHISRSGKPLNDGYLDELVAGMPVKSKHEDYEDYEECAMREIWEETGYRIRKENLEKISQFYPSPGGSSEIIHLYFGIVTEADRDRTSDDQIIGGFGEEEDTLVRHVPVSQFFDEPTPTAVVDSKLLIARLLLRDRLRALPEDEMRISTDNSSRFVDEHSNVQIVLRPGNVDKIKDVQIWVNPENTDMQMDRYAGGSISAVIRYLGALKFENGDIKEDVVAEDLNRKRRGARQARIGTTHVTNSGALQSTHGVYKIFHVATVDSMPGVQAYQPSAEPEKVQLATRRVLEKIHSESQKLILRNYTSALLPMLGAGDQGLTVETAFPKILDGLFEFIDAHLDTSLQEIHLSAFTTRDAQIACEILENRSRLQKVRR